MGAKLTDYEHSLRKRLEIIRKREKLKQYEMAECMGVSIERYKRFAYGESKIPIETIVNLMIRRPIDIDYLLRGKSGGTGRLVSYFLGCTNEDKAEFFMELAKIYRDMAEG